MLKRFLIVLAVLVLGFCSPGLMTVKAEDSSIGLVISPPIKEQSVKPGASFSDVIKVTNQNATSTMQVDVSVKDFVAKGEDGGQNFVDPLTTDTGYSLGKWVTIETSFTLNPNETKDVQYTVNVPVGAEAGGHYGTIFFTPKVTSTLSTSGVITVPQIGSLLLLTVPGQINYSGNIKEFLVSKNLYLDSKNTVNFLTRFENLSNVHVKPMGDIAIANTLGKNVANLKFNEGLGNVLPNSIRKFDNTWQNKYGFGRYKADLDLTFADNKTAVATIVFWIIPWKETAGVIILIILLVWAGLHLSWRRSQASAANQATPELIDEVKELKDEIKKLESEEQVTKPKVVAAVVTPETIPVATPVAVPVVTPVTTPVVVPVAVPETVPVVAPEGNIEGGSVKTAEDDQPTSVLGQVAANEVVESNGVASPNSISVGALEIDKFSATSLEQLRGQTIDVDYGGNGRFSFNNQEIELNAPSNLPMDNNPRTLALTLDSFNLIQGSLPVFNVEFPKLVDDCYEFGGWINKNKPELLAMLDKALEVVGLRNDSINKSNMQDIVEKLYQSRDQILIGEDEDEKCRICAYRDTPEALGGRYYYEAIRFAGGGVAVSEVSKEGIAENAVDWYRKKEEVSTLEKTKTEEIKSVKINS